jgi:hypothetical protein
MVVGITLKLDFAIAKSNFVYRRNTFVGAEKLHLKFENKGYNNRVGKQFYRW